MRRLSLFLFLFFSLVTTLVVTSFADYLKQVPQIETLSNGLKVVWFEDTYVPVLDVILTIQNRESGRDLDSRLFASIKEHSIRRPHSINSVGNLVSLSTHGLSAQTDDLLETINEFLSPIKMTPKQFTEEQHLFLDDWKLDQEDSVSHVRAVMHELLSNQRLNSGELLRLKMSDVTAFQKRVVTPENSVLAVVGKVDRALFREKIINKLTFGSEGAHSSDKALKKTPKKTACLPKDVGKETVWIIPNSESEKSYVRVGFCAPAMKSKDYYTLLVANALMGDFSSSGLNTLIRDKLGLAFNIQSELEYDVGHSVFSVSASTQTQAVGSLLKNIEVFLKTKPLKAPDVTLVKTVKDYLLNRYPVVLTSVNMVASSWLSGHLQGLDANFLSHFEDEINAVTPERVLEVIQEYTNYNSLVRVVSGNEKNLKQSLKAHGYSAIVLTQD